MPSRAAYTAVVTSLLNHVRAQENAVQAEGEAVQPDARQREREALVTEVTERLQQNLSSYAVSHLVVPVDKPIEDLPSIRAPELQLIGRCVSFGVKQTTSGGSAYYHYTGLVSMVTASAVTLMHVNRYTETDFKAYRNRERKATHEPCPHDFSESDGAAQTLILAVNDQVSATRESSQREADVSHFPCRFSEVFGSAFGGSTRAPADLRGSLAPAAEMVTGTMLDNLAAHHRHRESTAAHTQEPPVAAAMAADKQRRPTSLRDCAGSIGPLPYVSFLRKNIHDVAFGRSPDSSFFSLFQNPSKHTTDMQYLRMFVRRYLVHTSEGNNPDHVPLYAYLTEKGACSDLLNHDHITQLVREEVQELTKSDHVIAKEKKRMRNREARREATLRDYRAPSGIFADTGFLYLTGLPQGTLLTAAAMLFFACAFAGNYLLPVVITGDGLINSFFDDMNDTFMAAILTWVVASMLAFFHAVVMRVPSIANSPLLLLRVLSSAGTVVCAVLCLMLITRCTTNEYLQQRMRVSDKGELCAFYEQNKCAGFQEGCSVYGRNDPLCVPCVPVSYPDSPCYSVIMDKLQKVVLPLFLFSIVIFLSAVHSLFLIFKLFLVRRSVFITS